MIIVIIHYLQSQSTGISRTFVLSDQILFERIDIGVAIIYYWSYTILKKTLNYSGRAWGTTSMEQNFRLLHRYA
jgi:hypothetical protein